MSEVATKKKNISKVENEYNEDSISVLEGLEAVRKRPGMYIGSTDTHGLHHLIWEIFDNSADEVLAGYGDEIIVTILKGDIIRVRDYGRGVPVGMHKLGKSTPEIIFTVLHAGGKFGQGGYKTSGGLHGVGSSVVNALSEEMSVRIFKDGKEHLIEFHNGGKVKTPLTVVNEKSKERTGTEVTFKPDKEIFSSTKFKFEIIEKRLREKAFLMMGLRVVVRDERKEEVREEVFQFDNGLSDYVKFENEGKATISSIYHVDGLHEESGINVEVALQWNNDFSENTSSFVNNVRTRDGGNHETGFKNALTKTINQVARDKGLLKAKDKNLEGSDIREGLTAVVSVKVPENILQFVGQTKDKLGTQEARRAVEEVISDGLMKFFLDNAEVSERLIDKAIQARNLREKLKKERDMARNKTKTKKKAHLLEKYTPASEENSARNEIYIVEGDSAGGSAKQGRDRTFQAILPLRGKVLNTHGASISRILTNKEIVTMMEVIGGGIGESFELEDVNFDKVVIMTDADNDGAHIQVLLLTFFYNHMKPLVKAGKVYIAKPPLFKVAYGKDEIEYAWNTIELKEITKKLKNKKYTVQRYKGLGEMNAEQLWDTTMNPETRILTRVELNDEKDLEELIDKLMNDKRADDRKDWLAEEVDFDLE